MHRQNIYIKNGIVLGAIIRVSEVDSAVRYPTMSSGFHRHYTGKNCLGRIFKRWLARALSRASPGEAVEAFPTKCVCVRNRNKNKLTRCRWITTATSGIAMLFLLVVAAQKAIVSFVAAKIVAVVAVAQRHGIIDQLKTSFTAKKKKATLHLVTEAGLC